MGLSDKLVEVKSDIDALITYANGITGESDTRIGDAVRTLADGYGGGGLEWTTFYTATEEKAINSIITSSNPLPLHHATEIILIRVSGNNVQVGGTDTTRILIIARNNGASTTLNQRWYSTGHVAPDSTTFGGRTTTVSSAYIRFTNAGLWVTNAIDTYVAVGNRLEYMEIPIE